MSWRIQPTPTPNRAVLLDVTRVAWNDIWAVGEYTLTGYPLPPTRPCMSTSTAGPGPSCQASLPAALARASKG